MNYFISCSQNVCSISNNILQSLRLISVNMINVLDFWQTEEFLFTCAIIITTGNCNLAKILIWGLYFVLTAVVLMLKTIIPNFLCRVSKRP